MVLVGLAFVTFVGLAVVAVPAFIRAPRLVAQLDAAGILPFMPTALPGSRICALLAVQDPTIYRHQGIGLLAGPLGHTTVTQAICKGLFFNEFNPGLLRLGKVRLMIIAWAFDRRIPKDMQLRLFLNLTYFGSLDGKEIHGFPDAATSFFGKDLQSLSEQEYLGLVAMLRAPNTYHVVRNPQANAARVRDIRKLLERACAPE
jgi:membrane carboxypeptidase/penicillin-binding protein